MKKRPLYLAVLSCVAGFANLAAAVSASPDGRGDVLIYPYYTTRNGYDTYISIVNGGSETKAIKVRLLEGMNGAPVLSFNLYLPPQDIWTAAIVATADGARLVTADRSCAAPLGSDANAYTFSNRFYAGAVPGYARDPGPQGLDRTREGHLEVIEMGVLPNQLVINNVNLVNAVKHGSNGIPANCAAVQSIDITGQLSAATGGLSGTGYLVRSDAGLEFSYSPVVLADFSIGAATGIWYAPDDPRPTFNDANPRSTQLLARRLGSNGRPGLQEVVTDSGWATGAQAVAALLSTASIINEYVLEPSTASLTDWVVTFPTKRDFVFPNATVTTSVLPFQRPFSATTVHGLSGSACDDFQLEYFDRSARQYRVPEVIPAVFPPPPFFTPNLSLCYQTNVMGFATADSASGAQSVNSGLLGSRLNIVSRSLDPEVTFKVQPISPGFNNGWARLSSMFLAGIEPNAIRILQGNNNRYDGLPMVGFMVQTFTRNGLIINGVPSTSGYGGNFVHRNERRITPRTP